MAETMPQTTFEAGTNIIKIAGTGGERASGGSRTRNPRITNAVLCQLKLRWQWQLLQLFRTDYGRPSLQG